MTQQQIHDWLLESGFDNPLKNRYKRDFLNVEIFETDPGFLWVGVSIRAPGNDTSIELEVEISRVAVVDNIEGKF